MLIWIKSGLRNMKTLWKYITDCMKHCNQLYVVIQRNLLDTKLCVTICPYNVDTVDMLYFIDEKHLNSTKMCVCTV